MRSTENRDRAATRDVGETVVERAPSRELAALAPLSLPLNPFASARSAPGSPRPPPRVTFFVDSLYTLIFLVRFVITNMIPSTRQGATTRTTETDDDRCRMSRMSNEFYAPYKYAHTKSCTHTTSLHKSKLSEICIARRPIPASRLGVGFVQFMVQLRKSLSSGRVGESSGFWPHSSPAAWRGHRTCATCELRPAGMGTCADCRCTSAVIT